MWNIDISYESSCGLFHELYDGIQSFDEVIDYLSKINLNDFADVTISICEVHDHVVYED